MARTYVQGAGKSVDYSLRARNNVFTVAGQRLPTGSDSASPGAISLDVLNLLSPLERPLMADTQEWHFAQGDQKLGPISTAELKELATNGELSPADLIWKEGWPNWKQASSVKGLFPNGSAGRSPVRPETIRAATEAADQVSQKLWFLDLKFERFATPSLIGFIFAVVLAGLAILACVGIVHSLFNRPVVQAAFYSVGILLACTVWAVIARVILESCLLAFRIAEHLSYLRYLKQDK